MALWMRYLGVYKAPWNLSCQYQTTRRLSRALYYRLLVAAASFRLWHLVLASKVQPRPSDPLIEDSNPVSLALPFLSLDQPLQHQHISRVMGVKFL
ncbi:hypothetical protein M7I_1788 [Glarea lozoyensis 74030]|uniref:Uncharacterized protein n=1 Tax=Glarea lozoyensis (strain ATCC 74030 / MF5533) TaxID=1104152 RepID=H0EH53_GLAL7|nr:hypothetical protein M7I_1788 [Glarea lozoyensis 74030]